MQITTTIFLAFALAMDAFAVSVVNSMTYTRQTKRSIVFTSFMFGLFQTLMPIIGFLAGNAFIEIIARFDHWVAFILLGFIGGRMIYTCIKEWKEPVGAIKTQLSPQKRLVFTQAIATSIDALAVGISLAALGTNIYIAAINIGVITFVCCVIGHILGKSLGAIFSKWAQILGGAILIIIGTRIFIEHMFFQ